MPLLKIATERLRSLCLKAGIDESHGVGHALAVLAHTELALQQADRQILPARALAVRLAALLHDADDRKYFPDTCHTYANAKQIMEEIGVSEQYGETVLSDALKMINLVSCSANGNSCPPEAKEHPELLWPRWADRLEATGAIGVVRCYQYNIKSGAALTSEVTPAPRTAEEAFALATPERFEKYQTSGGQSASMMDHYFDKLLQIARPPPEIVCNRYLEEEALVRSAPLISVCLAFTTDGADGVMKRIGDMQKQLEEHRSTDP